MSQKSSCFRSVPFYIPFRLPRANSFSARHKFVSAKFTACVGEAYYFQRLDQEMGFSYNEKGYRPATCFQIFKIKVSDFALLRV